MSKFVKSEWLDAVQNHVAVGTVVTWKNSAGKVVVKRMTMTIAALAFNLAEKYADWETGEGVWVSQATLADKWGASRASTIIPSFRVLEILGFMKEDPSKAKYDSKYYDLTMPSDIADTSLVEEKIAHRQDIRAEQKRKERLTLKERLAEAKAEKEESPESPSDNAEVSTVTDNIKESENKTSGHDDTNKQPEEDQPETVDNDCADVLDEKIMGILGQSTNPELAEVYYRDVEFSPGNDEVKRAAMARSEADYDERRLIMGYDEYTGETLIEYILKARQAEKENV